MDRVVFLDRDGTINEEVHYLHRPEDLRILPGVAEGIARLRRAGFRIVVVTNQAGVARGYYGPEDVERLHACMNRQLEAAGALAKAAAAGDRYAASALLAGYEKDKAGASALLRDFAAYGAAGLRGAEVSPLRGEAAARAARLALTAIAQLERQVNTKIVLQVLGASI